MNLSKQITILLISTIFGGLIEFAWCNSAQAEDEQKSDLIVLNSETTQPANNKKKFEGRRFSGNVSWYGVPFNGRKTSSGRIFDMHKLTCAHRTLPFGTKVLVENPRTGQSVVVEVIDRGPFVRSRVMDLSREAARQAGTLLGGIAYVNCLVIPNSDQSSESKSNNDITNNSK